MNSNQLTAETITDKQIVEFRTIVQKTGDRSWMEICHAALRHDKNLCTDYERGLKYVARGDVANEINLRARAGNK